MKKITNLITISITIALLSIAILSVLSATQLFSYKFKLFVVQSGSMSPAIKTGSLILVTPSPKYAPGDVITYKTKEGVDIKNPKALVTHRIVDTVQKEDGVYYITKGDANNSNDSLEIGNYLVLGKVTASIPYLGYPVGFAKTQTGFIVLIVIPATLIIYSEMITIKNEAKRLLAERKKRKLTPFEKAEVAVGEEVMVVEKSVKRLEDELVAVEKNLISKKRKKK